MPKYLAHGTTVSIASKLIGGLVSVGIPDRSRGEAQSTDTDSAAHEYIGGLREGGTVELTFRHIPDDVGQTQLESNYNLDGGLEVEEVVITLPAAATTGSGSRTYTFDGFVIQPPTGALDTVADEAAEQTAVIKVGTAVTIA